jgi:hypothetical protein
MTDDKDWNDILREQGAERARETFNEAIKKGQARAQAGKGAPRGDDEFEPESDD